MKTGRGAMALSTGLAASLVAAPAGAALAPEWQRVREFHSVVDEGARLLGGRPIETIERLESGAYRVRGGGCEVVVTIVPKPQSMPGPQAFSLEPGKVACR